MPKRAILAVTIFGLVAGCGLAQRVNPLRLFGPSQRVETLEPVKATVAETRPLMDQVTSLRVDPTPGGAVVRATGLPPTQGWWDGALVPDDPDLEPVGGILTFTFRAVPPPGLTRVSTPQSREVVVGADLTRHDLDSIREIRVRAARNALAVRR
jgi:hypothetical protein